MEYTDKPDKWLLVRVHGTDPHWRIFGTWNGSYLHGDSWRLNSGIRSVEDKDGYYDFVGYSGSVYRCYKTGYGVTTYGMGVLTDLLGKSDLLQAVFEEPKDILKFMESPDETITDW
jgi:hypothetical protein